MPLSIQDSLRVSRQISYAHQIPVVGLYESRSRPKQIQLLRSDASMSGWLEDHGCNRTSAGWMVPRSDPFPFALLEQFLPRMAHANIVPETIDLIPSSSWFASLANMLSRSSWDKVRLPVIDRHGGCEECGSRGRLEVHEQWHYDEIEHVQSLIGLRCFCGICHEGRHLGRANITGRFDMVFDRLVRINRLRPDEVIPYRDLIFDTFLSRSKRRWTIDLSLAVPAGDWLSLKRNMEFGGDGWVFSPASADRDETAAQLVNVDIASDGKSLVLLPLGEGPKN